MTQDGSFGGEQPSIARGMGTEMTLYKDDSEETTNDADLALEPTLAPYLALDRLLRYARSEALSRHREKAARLIEAAIVSLGDTTVLSKH
jgi:hypothetical protein